MWQKIKDFLLRIRIHWVAVYAAYALLVYFRVFRFWGTIAFTALLVLFNKKIHALDIGV